MEDTKQERERKIAILPLRNSVLFPHSIVPIDVGRKKSIVLLDSVTRSEDQVLGVVAQRSSEIQHPCWDDVYSVGTAARILKVIRLDKGGYRVVLHGLWRFKIKRTVTMEPFHQAIVERVDDKIIKGIETEALVGSVFDTLDQVVSMLTSFPRDIVDRLHSSKDPSLICDLIASNISITIAEKQQILEVTDIQERLRLTLQFLMRQLEILKVKKEISSVVQEEMGKSQREYYLRQQLKAIREELGEADEEEDDIEKLRERIKQAELTQEAEEVAKKQIARLKQMQPSSAEYTVVRTYLDWIVELPWKKTTEDHIDISRARKILDEDHYDLDKVKKRILEYLAVKKLKEDKKGPILCFIGPPGVGKTSLGKSIARAMGRKFIRISLGGVRDEAEIRGHRRTYVGALPGRIIQGMKKVGTVNPVFMLDEVDKLGTDFRGDPSSALLEVLDPEQNYSFVDHYLEIPYDLSKVMFIGTANIRDTIPPPLLDRMETIDLPGYTRDEKRKIAQQFLIPRQLIEHGLKDYSIKWEESAIEMIIDSYTREAGVRNLEREIASICRFIAVKVAEEKPIPEVINKALVEEVLGHPKFYSEVAGRVAEVGVATGLAWTPAGGDIIFVEATKMAGQGKLHLTGQLGSVMKESVQAALSYIHSRSNEFGISEEAFEKTDLHVHVPAGAIPKDGPSAGITMFVALASRLTGIAVRPDVAMTGEITLRGTVLQVGGIKEKVLAAHRAEIKEIILPDRNRKDLMEVPGEIKAALRFHFIKEVDEALELALVSPIKSRKESQEKITTPAPQTQPSA